MNSFISFANKRTKKVYDAIMERISTIDQINYRIINEFISRKNFYLRPGLIFLTAELFGASAYDALLPAISM